MTGPTPNDIKKARIYLQKQGIRSSDISPRKFAASAKEMGKGFRETLNFLARLLSGGQGQGPSPKATKNVDQLDPKNAIGGDAVDYAGEAKE